MARAMSSRERMLAALSCQEADHVPCCFMIFAALSQQCRDQFEFVDRQLALGLDAVVTLPSRWMEPPRELSEQGDLRGLPVHFDPSVTVRDWREERVGEAYPLLHREYGTPAGVLSTTVIQTDDWVQGDRVPLFDDFVIPRARKRLVERPEDLEPLRYLLTPPTSEDVAALRGRAAVLRAFAEERGVIVEGGWSAVVDAACWLAGMMELVLLAIDQPDFLCDFLTLIEEWNRARMAVVLDAGVELLVRRGWYELGDVWSPTLYREFILPSLERDVAQAHEAGAKFGYIMTSGQMGLLDMLLEAGVDALIGVDPVQGKGTDFETIKARIGDRVCLWGGVNGFVTVETGQPDDVRGEVRRALEALGPGGGFVLSPVDNVRENSERAWANVRALVDEWSRGCQYPMREAGGRL